MRRLSFRPSHVFAAALYGLVTTLFAALPLSAQTPAAPPTETASESKLETAIAAKLDGIRAALTQIETTLDRPGLPDATLLSLRAQLGPMGIDVRDALERLTPRLAASKSRLDQLGPKPDDKQPPENPAISTERADQQAVYDRSDALLKTARLLSVQLDQTANHVAARQRALFTRSLFERSTSIASPALWMAVATETPTDLAAAKTVLGDWLRGINAQLAGWRIAAFWGALLVIALATRPLYRIMRRVMPRDREAIEPTRFRKVLAAWWVAFVVAALPITILLLVGFLATVFDLSNDRMMPLVHAVIGGVVRVSLAAGLSAGLLAPWQAKWRLFAIDDQTVHRLLRLVLLVAVLVSLTRAVEALNDIIAATLPFSVATRGVGSLIVALVMAASLRGIVGAPDEEAQADVGLPRQNLSGLLRLVVWAAIAAVVIASFVGFVALSSFLVDQVVWIAAVATLLTLGLIFVDEFWTVGFRPEAPLGRAFASTLGLRREALEQMAVLLGGFGRLVLMGVAGLAVLAPWGVQSDDWVGSLTALFFGFKVGEVTISLVSIACAIVIFIVGSAITRGVQNWLEARYLPLTRLDFGLRNSIKTSVGYIGFVIAVGLALAYLGLDFQKLAIVAGALSVGIGFGLQSIVNNFVSGLIILWERAVRVGDWIVVGADQGFVRRINVRSTEIETFDRAAVIIPNSNLITGVVKNLVRMDRVGRILIDLTVDASADPESVRMTLIELAKAHSSILALPAPQVRFIGLSAANLQFELVCFIDDVESSLRVKSDLYFTIFAAFKEKGFLAGPPAAPLAVEIAGLDRLEALVRPQQPEPARPRGAAKG